MIATTALISRTSLAFPARMRLWTRRPHRCFQTSRLAAVTMKNDDDNDAIVSNTGGARLEYQHGSHAGGYADVFKHVLLTMILEHMQRKSKPIGYVETHSGAGSYTLGSPNLQENMDQEEEEHESEYKRGIWRLRDVLNDSKAKEELPTALSTYLDIVKSVQNESSPSSETMCYPGSPLFAASQLLQSDGKHSMRLFDKAADQCDLLYNHLKAFLTKHDTNRRIAVRLARSDGYSALAEYARSTPSLPPRALILIDPPYQYGSDTDQVITLCRNLRRHWRSARIAIWHPVRSDHEERTQILHGRLQSLRDDLEDTFDILSIQVHAPLEDRNADVGSGMLLLNPTFGLEDECREVFPKLLELLDPSWANKDAIQIKSL